MNQTKFVIDEEDNDDSFDDDWDGDGHTRGDLILKVRNQPKPTAAFTSQVLLLVMEID